MKIDFTSKDLDQIEHPCLVVLAKKDGHLLNGPKGLAEELKPFVDSGEFGAKLGDDLYLFHPKSSKTGRVLFLNMGAKIEKSDQYRCATAKAWKILRKKRVTRILFSLDGIGNELETRAAVEGFLLGNYQFTELKTDKSKLEPSIELLTFHSSEDCHKKVEKWRAICRGTCRARDLCQTPANILTPRKLAEITREWSGAGGFSTEILEEAAMRKEGMGAMLSVSQGSVEPAQFIIMDYQPENPSGKTIALVGKAVTFDSGGLSLKPSASMPEMKGDMGGGAAVIGVMTTLKAAGCRHRVIGLVPSVENMPSGSATRPSDVVTSLSGVTVEINNTDAEGRLILADALTYADRYQPDYVIDFATLTGACLIALGPKVYGVLGNHQPLVDAILRAGKEVHEPFWQLPLVEEYKEFLKSDVADISNISTVRWGGTITAGLFLERFAGKYKWAHCDIAAAIFEKSDDYSPTGGSGAGVRTTVRVLEDL